MKPFDTESNGGRSFSLKGGAEYWYEKNSSTPKPRMFPGFSVIKALESSSNPITSETFLTREW